VTQYERGVKLEREIQHFYEYHDHMVISSRGSHGDADLAVFLDEETRLIQCKLHVGLRDKIAEDMFKAKRVAHNVTKWIAWKSSGRSDHRRNLHNKKLIVVQNLDDRSLTYYIEPLNKEQEKQYQLKKKLRALAIKGKKLVPITIKR
jgi:hypothetical protein